MNYFERFATDAFNEMDVSEKTDLKNWIETHYLKSVRINNRVSSKDLINLTPEHYSKYTEAELAGAMMSLNFKTKYLCNTWYFNIDNKCVQILEQLKGQYEW